ncbi:MAG: pyrroline-5-carboxylate reductase [Spirochaetes bacterium]|nr:pyrroline-5-carboxylate reductase [Brevinematales bacterium]MCL1959452.1 pyrroline-5-carboxylate reductase [Spirochaetota bacterium]
MINNIVCIGSGNMGYALMKSASAGTDGAKLFLTDVDAEKAASAAASLGAEVLSSNIEAVNKGDYIFLAVKPQVLPQVLAEITDTVKTRINAGSPPVLVSMAAGWSIEKIKKTVSAKASVVRIMPNTPALIGKGMIALAASPEVQKTQIIDLEHFLGGAGIIDKIDENLMDAVTALSGSGPAFVYLFIEALADGGVRAGLPRDKALRYAAQTIAGAAAMVQKTEKHPGELKDMVTSPGGTTIAGITALENGAFRGTVIKAVEAAWRRAVELG